MKGKLKLISAFLLLVLILNIFIPTMNEMAAEHGSGYNMLSLGFSTSSGNYRVYDVTVNGDAYTDNQDVFKTTDGKYTILGKIESTDESRPRFSYGGNVREYLETQTIEIRPESDPTEYSFSIVLEDIGTATDDQNNIINFIAFNVDPENQGSGGSTPTSSYTLTFNVKEGLTGDDYVISNEGNHLIIGGVIIDFVDVSNPETNITFSIDVATDGRSATLVTSGNMAGSLNFNTDKFTLFANDQQVNERTVFDNNTSIQIEEHVDQEDNPDDGNHGGDNTQNYQGNATATLNYKITGAIEYGSGGGYDHGITFRINDIPYAADESKMQYTEDIAYERTGYGELVLDENNNPVVIKDPETNEPLTEKTGLTITGDTINYDYDTNTNKVNFTFAMAPGTLMTGLKINNRTITDLPSTKEELAACYTDHRIEIEVNDIDVANEYNIEITARYPNSDEEFLGNFLWDYNPKGYTGPEDKILNATLTFVEAEYNGVKYTTEKEINDLGGIFIWNDAPRKKKYTDEREGVGEAQFPVGTKLTVKIIPDTGYQLIDFGINGGAFEPQDEIGTYTFEVHGGPFHLQANIAQVDNVVKTKSEKVESGSIEFGGTEDSMAIGTARLDVDDVNLTQDQISNFEDAAEGYEIKDYIDISLFNTVFKGKETESWDTEVKDLDNEATITLQLEEGVDGNEVVIVHEKHDGTYEIIPVEYDASTNTITFKTKSFSNYAIATNKTSTKATSNATKTGDAVILFFVILAIATVGVVIVIKHKRK